MVWPSFATFRRSETLAATGRAYRSHMADAGEPGDARPVVSGATSGDGRPNRRQIVMRIAVEAGILLVVFGVFLPRVVDYDAVRAALARLTFGQAALLTVATAVAYVANAGPIRSLIEGLSWPRGVGADLAARAVASTIPGPTDVATRFVLYRQWLIPADTAIAGIVFGGFLEMVSSLLLPLIALVGVIISGEMTDSRAIWLAVIGVVILGASKLLIALVIRSESFAMRVGEGLDGLARHVWALLRRAPPSGIVDAVLDLQARSKEILSGHGKLSLAMAMAARLAWLVVLEICLWAVGLGPDVLSPSMVLAAMAVVAIVGMIPITPGGVGVTEVAYIGVLSAISGAPDAVTAAIMLFRVVQWLLPIPIGWILLLIMRRGHWGEMLGQPGQIQAARRELMPQG